MADVQQSGKLFVHRAALELGCPEIFNTDQGVQFTNRLFTSRLEQTGVSISMDGRGPALDNVFVDDRRGA